VHVPRGARYLPAQVLLGERVDVGFVSLYRYNLRCAADCSKTAHFPTGQQAQTVVAAGAWGTGTVELTRDRSVRYDSTSQKPPKKTNRSESRPSIGPVPGQLAPIWDLEVLIYTVPLWVYRCTRVGIFQRRADRVRGVQSCLGRAGEFGTRSRSVLTHGAQTRKPRFAFCVCLGRRYLSGAALAALRASNVA